jgi:hypothetical protein
MKRRKWFSILTAVPLLLGGKNLMADDYFIIDDRQSSNMTATLGSSWRLITDKVMGGLSSGNIAQDEIEGRACLRLYGNVRLENRGGFLQAALDIQQTAASDASGYQGLLLEVFGNDRDYNLHLRTDDVWLPWQSYRASFHASPRWRVIKLPFKDFNGYRIGAKLDLKRLKRIGLLAIGEKFSADLCIARLAFYRERQHAADDKASD